MLTGKRLIKRGLFSISLICLLSAIGCSSPTPKERKEASIWCNDFGGTKNITSNPIMGLRARCNDNKLIIKD